MSDDEQTPESPADADRASRGSDAQYCERYPDDGHCWEYTHPGGMPASGVWYRHCTGCDYVDVSELAGHLAAHQRFIAAFVAAQEAVAMFLPVMIQALQPIIAGLTEIAKDAEQYASPSPQYQTLNCPRCGGVVGVAQVGEPGDAPPLCRECDEIVERELAPSCDGYPDDPHESQSMAPYGGVNHWACRRCGRTAGAA